MENFVIVSGKIRVTDPCYTKDTWCSGVLENCMNGKWFAGKVVWGNEATGGWGNRIAELQIWHESHVGSECYENSGIDVGVDSGQAGFFDEGSYPEGETGEYGELDTFYGKICEGTANENYLGIANVGFGVATSSGYGDGGYDCFIRRDHEGRIVAAKIVFISAESEEDEEDYEWDDEA
jgi:hypothetical protein